MSRAAEAPQRRPSKKAYDSATSAMSVLSVRRRVPPTEAPEFCGTTGCPRQHHARRDQCSKHRTRPYTSTQKLPEPCKGASRISPSAPPQIGTRRPAQSPKASTLGIGSGKPTSSSEASHPGAPLISRADRQRQRTSAQPNRAPWKCLAGEICFVVCEYSKALALSRSAWLVVEACAFEVFVVPIFYPRNDSMQVLVILVKLVKRATNATGRKHSRKGVGGDSSTESIETYCQQCLTKFEATRCRCQICYMLTVVANLTSKRNRNLIGIHRPEMPIHPIRPWTGAAKVTRHICM